MNWSRFTRGAAAIAAATLLLAACADRGADEPGTEEPTSDNPVRGGYFPQDGDPGEPTRGGTLSYADYSEARSLDPSQIIPSGASGGSAIIAVYDQLVRLNVETQLFEPRMAESVEPNDDHTEWTIKLKPGIKFSDGTDLNADALVGSMNWYMGTRGYDVSTITPLWGGVTKVDDLTATITLTESWATFDAMLARGLGWIVAPAAIDGGPENFTPIGAGPFTSGSYAPGEELVLKANPNHWDGAPYLDELRFVWLGADQTKYEALQGGSVQVTYINDLVLNDEIATKNLPRYVLTASNGQMLILNLADGNATKDDRVRRALALAMDPQAIAERTAQGKGYYGKTLFSPISKWYDDTVEVNEFDAEEAAKLVEEAKADGFDGKITITANATPLNSETVLSLKAQFDAIGFETDTDLMRNVTDFIQRMFVERSYETAVFGHQVVDNDPFQDLYGSYHSKAASNLHSNNDAEMDALLDELRATPLSDEAAARDVIHRLETHYQEAIPSVTFRYLTPTIAWDDNVYGVVGLNDAMVDFGKAWIKP